MWYVADKKEFDGRRFGQKVLEEIRARGVVRVEAGKSRGGHQGLGASSPRIYQLIAKYREGGTDVLWFRSALGHQPIQSDTQLQMIYRIVTKEDHRQLKLPFAFWTYALTWELIWQKFQIHLKEVSFGRAQSKLGPTPQRPLWCAYQEGKRLVVCWTATQYPEIQAMAKAPGAAIFWGNE